MSFLTDVGINDIPWFSRSEWLHVFKGIFSNKYEDWVKAYNHICVWKVRVSKLPVGIECTIPLLNAQIALADHAVNNALKTSVLNMAILRFVSVVTKGYEQRFTVGKKMHDLAVKMNLPLYLIDLRNQIIHSDNIFGCTETYHAALNVCFRWIQVNYWKVEEKKLKSTVSRPIKPRKIKNLTKSMNTDKEMSPSKLCFQIENRLLHFTTHCRNIDKDREKKLERMLNLEIISYSASNQEDAMNILVSELFVSAKFVAWLNRSKNSGNENCECVSHDITIALWYFAPHLFIIFEIGCINIFINSLIGEGTDTDSIRRKWLEVLINMSFHGNSVERKIFLDANEINLWKYSKVIDWKEHVSSLFSLLENWSFSLARSIIKKKSMKIGSARRKSIIELIKLYQNSFRKVKILKVKKSLSKAFILEKGNKMATLETLINEAHRVSENDYKYITKLLSGKEENREDKIVAEKMYLGVLPHQVGDPLLFKKLIISNISQGNI